MVPNVDPLSDFRSETFNSDGFSREVFTTGSGPAVIVIPEIPGFHPGVADFARRLAAEGYTAVVPSLFGTPGKPASKLYEFTSIAKACVAKEFSAFAGGKSSPISVWLRALARSAHEDHGGNGVGVVGMCFTGGFALGMMLEPAVLVPVLSQPSLPLPISKARRASIDASPEELAVVRERIGEGACVLGFRFTKDRLVGDARFDRLRRELGDGFIAVEIDSAKGNPHGFDPMMAHSVLTHEFSDEPGHPTKAAYDLLIEHLRARL